MKIDQKGSVAVVATVVVLALAIGVFGYFSQKESSSTQVEATQEVSSTSENVSIDVSETSKGIVVTSVEPNDLVKLPITIEGYLDGQGWFANEGEIGVVEVFDANGKSVSNREVIETTTDWMKFPTYFKTTVGDRQMMSYITTDTGVVRITANGAKDGEQAMSISIPVRFR